jgi:transposase
VQLAELVSHVIGVDTHKHTHTAAVVDAATGGAVPVEQATADRGGYEALVDYADMHSTAGERAWAIEGTGSYGAGLCDYLSARGEWVIELDRPSRPARRDGAKSDALDAVRAAREALGREKWAQPRGRNQREAMRVVSTTRDAAVRDRTRAINQLKAVIVSAPDSLRERVRTADGKDLIDRCLRLRTAKTCTAEVTATVAVLRRLAKRIRHLNNEVADHDRDLKALTKTHCPQLLAEVGVGHVIAAQTYISWSHPGRCRNEAAFAQLGGSAPIDASSGETVRRRLNRGGDRQLNRALHLIVLTRARCHQPTKDYIAKRVAEGKSEREARRCLKRYLARRLYRLLERPEQTLDKT